MSERLSDREHMRDVLVIGGGPAGAAAAITARGLGLSVAIVEAEATPRERPGETVHAGIETVLDHLGVGDEFRRAGFDRFREIAVERDGALSSRALGADEHGPWEGFHLQRSRFDELLRRRAADVGAEVLVGARAIEVLREGSTVVGAALDSGDVRARMTIDASGHHGWLSRRLGLVARAYSEPLFVGFGYSSNRECVQNAQATNGAPVFRPAREGWTWEADVRSGVRAWVRIARDAREARRAPEGMSSETKSSARGVTWRVMRPTAGAGFLLAGDAAARLDPASGQGILRALVAGVQAARTAHRALGSHPEKGLALLAWDRWVVDTFEEQAARLELSYAEMGIELAVTSRCGLL
jgi:flavin-dependent dehydrogenase